MAEVLVPLQRITAFHRFTIQRTFINHFPRGYVSGRSFAPQKPRRRRHLRAARGNTPSPARGGRPHSQAETVLRPLSLLRESTLRPLRVFMRWRKPWTFLRCLFLGWYVPSISCTSFRYILGRRLSLPAPLAFDPSVYDYIRTSSPLSRKSSRQKARFPADTTCCLPWRYRLQAHKNISPSSRVLVAKGFMICYDIRGSSWSASALPGVSFHIRRYYPQNYPHSFQVFNIVCARKNV